MKSIHKEAKSTTDPTVYAATVANLPWRILKITLISILNNKLRLLILLYVSFRLSRKMHDNLVSRVLHAPINLYFDITPVGKILNSFSRDLNATDHHSMKTFIEFGGMVYKNVAKLALACYIVPQITPILVINCFAAFREFKYLKGAIKAINKVGNVG